MTPHQLKHYVGGSPVQVTLVNDQGDELPDWFWVDVDPETEQGMYSAIAGAIWEGYSVEAAKAGHAMIKAIHVYDEWWTTCKTNS